MNLKMRPSWDAKLWSFCLIILQTNNLKEHKRFSFPLDLKKNWSHWWFWYWDNFIIINPIIPFLLSQCLHSIHDNVRPSIVQIGQYHCSDWSILLFRLVNTIVQIDQYYCSDWSSLLFRLINTIVQIGQVYC